MTAMKARSLDELICDLNMTYEDVTPGGCVRDDVCVAWEKVGMIVWQVRETRFAGHVVYVRIICNVIVEVAGGEFAAVPLPAFDELEHCNCPLEFLTKVPGKTKDKAWRDRVWAWHEAKLTQELEKTAAKKTSWTMKATRNT